MGHISAIKTKNQKTEGKEYKVPSLYSFLTILTKIWPFCKRQIFTKYPIDPKVACLFDPLNIFFLIQLFRHSDIEEQLLYCGETPIKGIFQLLFKKIMIISWGHMIFHIICNMTWNAFQTSIFFFMASLIKEGCLKFNWSFLKINQY